MDQGVASDKVETAAYGEERNLTKDEVKGLEEANPAKAAKKHMNKNTTWLAYNRRADVVLLPSGQKSAQYYPNDASDVDVLWQLAKPNIKKVEKEQ